MNNTRKAAIGTVSMLAGIALMGVALANPFKAEVTPEVTPEPAPQAEPTLEHTPPPPVKAVVVNLDDVVITGTLKRPAKPMVKRAPCVDGERRLVGFEGDPAHPSKFRGVTIHCN